MCFLKSVVDFYDKLNEILQAKLPLDAGVENLLDFLTAHASAPLDVFSTVLRQMADAIDITLLFIPPLLFIFLVVLVMGYVRTWKHGLFTGIALLLVFNMGLWEETMLTLALVLTATILAIGIGIPLGILIAHNKMAYIIMRPVLDFMQTIPPFVYLIPAMMFFGLGKVPAIAATVIFAAPPAIRLTRLGFVEIPTELIEAGHAFGANSWQMLWKIEFPSALPTIKAGINQTIMMALSMMVIAAMIGAKGLGQEVLRSLSWIDAGMGFEAGICIVILAVVIDRLVTG